MSDFALKHISPSSMNSAWRCWHAWYLHYIEGLNRIPPGIHRGRGVHKAVEANNKQKLTSHQDMIVSDLTDIAATEFEKGIANEGLWVPREDEWQRDSIKGAEKDIAVRLTRFYGETVAATIQPVLVEQEFSIPLFDGIPLVGRLDLVDDNGWLRDDKTTLRSKQQKDADTDLGLTAYSMALERAMGQKPRSIVVDAFVALKKSEKHQILHTERGEADYLALIERAKIFVKTVQAGNFPPANPSLDFYCSPRSCGYWPMCKYVNSARSSAAKLRE